MHLCDYFLFEKLTVYSEHVRLYYILIPESVARVITSMFQLHVRQIEATVVENANLRRFLPRITLISSRRNVILFGRENTNL